MNTVAIITGGCSGIGAATARQILTDFPDSGCALVDLVEGESQAVIDAFGGDRVRHFHCDVTDPSSVNASAAEVADWRPGIRMLVNSAGIQIKQPTMDFDPEAWAKVMDVHLSGTLYWSQAAGRTMAALGGGAIVNLASVSMYVALPRRAAYACAKAAVGALTRTLAVEWAEHGIRVNAVAPGWIMTPLALEAIQRDGYDLDTARSEHALGRFGETTEVARVISFLLSDSASFVTGEVMNVDGGYMALKGN